MPLNPANVPSPRAIPGRAPPAPGPSMPRRSDAGSRRRVPTSRRCRDRPPRGVTTAIHTEPTGSPPCGSGPATPVVPMPMSAPRFRAAPAAIDSATSALTMPRSTASAGTSSSAELHVGLIGHHAAPQHRRAAGHVGQGARQEPGGDRLPRRDRQSAREECLDHAGGSARHDARRGSSGWRWAACAGVPPARRSRAPSPP